MAWAKVRAGVLRLETPSGPRYLKLNLVQRLRVLWIFRNFRSLSLGVLCDWQRELLEQLCRTNEFVSWKGLDRARVIGSVESVPFSVVVRSSEQQSAMGVPLAANRRA